MEYLKIEPNTTVLVLNSSYEPLNFCNWKRAVILLLKNKAHVIGKRIIRLVHYVKLPISRIMSNKPSRRMIHKRDDNTCQYCGCHEKLTIDHVLPRSRGGQDTWENMVCACISCNMQKNNRTPEEWGKSLLRKPKAPFNTMTFSLNKCDIPEWKEYSYAS